MVPTWVRHCPEQSLQRRQGQCRCPGDLTKVLCGHHSKADKGPWQSACPASHSGLSSDGLEPQPKSWHCQPR